MGIYLPPSIQTPLVIGAVLGYLLDKKLASRSKEEGKAARRRGTLFASGLIVGESIVGVALAGLIAVSVSSGGSESPLAVVGADFADTAEMLGLVVFALVVFLLGRVVTAKGK